MRQPTYGLTASALFAVAPPRSALRRALRALGEWSPMPADPGPHGWMSSGPRLVLATPAGPQIEVDVVDRRWPDGCVHPSLDRALDAARDDGCFGAGTREGALGRAVLTATLVDAAGVLVRWHEAFVRIRVRTDGNAVDARTTALVVAIGAQIMSLDDALIWFAPGGELLLGEQQVAMLSTVDADEARPAYEAFVSVRQLRSTSGDHLVVDTVGAAQFGLVDLETVVPPESAEVAEARLASYEILFAQTVRAPSGTSGVPGESMIEPARQVVFRPTPAWAA